MSQVKNKRFVVHIPDGKVFLDVKVMTKEKQICPLCKKKFHLSQHLKNKHKFNRKQVTDIIQHLKPEAMKNTLNDIVTQDVLSGKFGPIKKESQNVKSVNDELS